MNSEDLENSLSHSSLAKPSPELDRRMDVLFLEHAVESSHPLLAFWQWRPSMWQTALACTSCALIGVWLGRSTPAIPAEENNALETDTLPAIEIHITPEEALAMMEVVNPTAE